MTSTINNRDTYLAQLIPLTPPPNPQLQDLRTQAAGYLQEENIPTNKNEEWRFTNLSPLLEQAFAAPSQQLPPVSIDNLAIPEATQSRLVFINGIYAPSISSLVNLPTGVFTGDLAAANAAGLAVTDYLGKQPGGEEVFTAINTAGINEAAVVWLAPDVIFETPIHLLFITTVDDTAIATHPRTLVVLEQRSSATIVQEYLHTSASSSTYFNNSVTEIWLGEAAKLNHTRIQTAVLPPSISVKQRFHNLSIAPILGTRSSLVADFLVTTGKSSKSAHRQKLISMV